MHQITVIGCNNICCLARVCPFLEKLGTKLEAEVMVKTDTGSDADDQRVLSTLTRDLQFLLSPTVRDYALIGRGATAAGLGIAPSILSHRRKISV